MGIDEELLKKLICPHCKAAEFTQSEDALTCKPCGKSYKINSGIPDFLSDHIDNTLHWDIHSDPLGYEQIIANAGLKRLKRIDEPILKYVKGDCLEIGCGTCRLGKEVEKQGARYFGIDPAITYLTYAREKYGLNKLAWARGEKLPFKNESFDSLISGYFAFRYVEPVIGLREARRVLKKDGVFAFDIINLWLLKLLGIKGALINGAIASPQFFNEIFSSLGVFDFWSLPQLRRLAKDSGFLLEKIISSVLIPFPLLQRLNNILSGYYFRGKMSYLGYDVIVVLRAA